MWHAWEKTEKYKRSWWGKPEGKRPLGRRRFRWTDGVRMNFRAISSGGVDSVGSG
jgi:hypothetical protein